MKLWHVSKNILKSSKEINCYKNLLLIVFVWLLLSINFINTIPFTYCSNDTIRHKEYTEVIIKEHRLPKPYEKLLTYHPPLYYLLNSYFLTVSGMNQDQDKHEKFVRILSSIYGVISLIIIFKFLSLVSKNEFLNLIVTLFIGTTPRFFFTFNSYSNDSLSTLLCLITMVLSYKLSNKWSPAYMISLLLVSTAAIYTKYTSIWCIGIILIICLKDIFLKLKLPSRNQLTVFSILSLSLLLFTPWAFFHNYKYTKQWIPFRSIDEVYILKTFNFSEHIKTLKEISTPPFFNIQKWSSPLVYPSGGPATKNNDYLSYTFITSVTGEYTFFEPNVIFIWLILLIHLIVYIISFKEIFSTAINKIAFSFILLSHLVHVINLLRLKTPLKYIGYFMEYRFILWSILGWAVLYASRGNKSESFIFILIIGIVVNSYFLINAVGGNFL